MNAMISQSLQWERESQERAQVHYNRDNPPFFASVDNCNEITDFVANSDLARKQTPAQTAKPYPVRDCGCMDQVKVFA